MSISTKIVLVLSGAFILSAVMASCSSGPTTVEIVKTTRAQNKIDNLAATREVALAAGENPDDVQVKIAKGSQADKVIEERNATATALAEEGIVSVGSGSFMPMRGIGSGQRKITSRHCLFILVILGPISGWGTCTKSCSKSIWPFIIFARLLRSILKPTMRIMPWGPYCVCGGRLPRALGTYAPRWIFFLIMYGRIAIWAQPCGCRAMRLLLGKNLGEL